MTSHYRLQLNNACQALGYPMAKQSCNIAPGARYATWVVVYYVNGIEYGRAQGPTVDGAAEIAASNALVNLRYQFPGYGF